MAKKYSPEVISALKELVEHFDGEDKATRERQLRDWRRLKLLWEGFTRTWYSEVAHDWRIWDAEQVQDDDQAYYDKPVNVFRAYIESIIAALSVTVPPVRCYPDDADNPLDLSTAKAGDKIASLVYRHNDVSLLWVHALFIFMTEGMTACYNYTKTSKEYGTYKEKEYEDIEEEHESSVCPLCNFELSDRVLSEQERNEFDPSSDDVLSHDVLFTSGDVCPSCLEIIDPEIKKSTLIITRLVGETDQPKSRICMEVYGGLNVKVANYARTQKETPYLIYSYETHYSFARAKYPHMDIKGGQMVDSYEQWARLNPQFRSEYPNNTVTLKHAWLRPESFHTLNEESAKLLLKHFPDGAKVSLVNKEYADACNESLDDHWTLTYNPLSDYLTHDPLGLLLVSIQDITNDLISLTLQTIEHGIPQTFVSPDVVNLSAYKQLEAAPGSLIPTKAGAGKDIGKGFYEIKTATLSQEVLPFAEKVQQLGQLVSGALPSLFGGQGAGSETASEYAMSRSQALQRLGNQWKIFTFWWKNIFSKVIPAYMDELKDDERFVDTNDNGDFLNVYIRKAEIEGKIGRVEVEANENLPLNWTQRKDIVMALLNGGNPEILEIIGSPENLPIIREAIGLTDFYIPGEDDRQKQYEEIKELVNSEPIMSPMGVDPAGEPIEEPMPSVEVEPDVDNHAVQFEICRIWLISAPGRMCKNENPEGYKNVLLHAKMHQFFLMQQMAPPVDESGAINQEKPKQNTAAPIDGESNVQIQS